MTKILIVGGAGFIGSNLCELLLKKGEYVICLDNLYTGNIENIQHLLDHPHFTFINHDIVEPLVLEEQIDQIYNLACPASPPKYQKDPIYTLKINFQGVMNLLEFAKIKGATFLQSSTSEIYGEPEITPQSETYRGNVNTIGIRSCYDEGKRIAETLIMEYHRIHGVKTRIARIFNTYGPNMDKDDGRVVSNFINQSLNNESITLYGDGLQTRSFCYIDDQLDGLIKLMNADPEYIYPVNIGNPHEITVKELATLVIRLTDSESKLVYKPLPSDDPTNRKPDILRAREILGWEPTCHLEEGIKKTIAYYKSKMQTI